MLRSMNWVQWVTFGIAVVGATLGVFNAWWMVRRDTVRLRVRYLSIYVPGTDTWSCGIEVTNLGYLAVTVDGVAFRERRRSKMRYALLEDTFGRTQLPFRLEPREGRTIVGSPELMAMVGRRRINFVQASTACGVIATARIKREGA